MNKFKETISVFEEIWDDDNVYDDLNIKEANTKFNNWSDGLLDKWIENTLVDNDHPRILDIGCGLGFSAASLLGDRAPKFKYSGIDLIDLSKTKIFLKNAGFDVDELLQIDFNSYTPRSKYDLVVSIKVLHHTSSLLNSFKSLINFVELGGRFIVWIINEPPPIRRATEDQIRKFYFGKSKNEQLRESKCIAALSMALAEALGEKTFKAPRVESMGLEAGEYKIQTFLYDFVIKLPAFLSTERSTHQVYDWYAPPLYHSIGEKDLHNFLSSIQEIKYFKVVSKVNGHMIYGEINDV